MSEPIFVYIDLENVPHFVGRLWVNTAGRNESASFEYDMEWQKSSHVFALEPALAIANSRYHTSNDKALFGSMGDSAPDRWGRTLMQREIARQAKERKTPPQTLREIDYLLMVNDEARMGALRFSASLNGTFLAVPMEGLPPLIALGSLLQSANKIENRKEVDQDIKDILAPGSSLGGARPKASIRCTDGRLCIAKFPSQKDSWDVPLWEYVAFKIAQKSGIQIPPVELVKIAGRNVLLLDRFDRSEEGKRIPYLSAMSMLQHNDGEHGSYLEIAEVLSEKGARSSEDKKELWQRIVLNILISNYDDHLRNHGFLHQGTDGWRLSPVFDLESSPAGIKERRLHTFIGFDDALASLDEAYEVIDEFGLALPEAREIVKKTGEAVCNWRRWAKQKGAKAEEVDFMSTAFEHEDLKKASKSI